MPIGIAGQYIEAEIAFNIGVHIKKCLNKLEQDVEPAAKALAVSEPMAIFHAGHGKS